MQKTPKEPYAGHSDAAVELTRTQAGILISNPVNRRLVEGVAAQLQLVPVILEEQDLQRPEQVASLEILIADEPQALQFRKAFDALGDPWQGMRPAVVAITSAPSGSQPAPENADLSRHFDGLLVLPQRPALIVAQLSVILYAHRTHVHRFESSLEELRLNRRIFRSVTSAIIVASATEPDYPVTYANPAFEVMTGYSLDEVMGKNCRFLQGRHREQRGLQLIRESLAQKREVVVVLRNCRKNGTEFWNEISLSPIRNSEGEVTHIVSIQSDVSSRIAFEEALRESEKLAAAGRLAASIAHEINNPLEAVTNLLYLARGKTTDPEVQRYLDQADEEVQRVSHIAAQSLRFSRQSLSPQQTRAGELISSVLGVYEKKLAQAGVVIDREDRRSAPVVCLESEIRQVLSNLVSNALEAMPPGGGRLLLRTRDSTEWRSGVKGVVFTVADTGLGMSPETMPSIYKPFYTTKGSLGTGLGLWVCSEIVERHQGRLLVRSSVGPRHTGTVFELFLPHQPKFEPTD